MPDFKTLYFHLFNAMTDALVHMSAQNFGLAADRLKTAQQQAEELYIGVEQTERT